MMVSKEALYTGIERSVTREQWYGFFYRTFRKAGYVDPQDHSIIGRRSRMKSHLDSVRHNGKVALNVDQMDCDCARWTSGRIIDAHPLNVEREIDEVLQNAEGPVYMIEVVAPVDIAGYVSRDLALEAYEDGHPHSVSASRYDEDGDY